MFKRITRVILALGMLVAAGVALRAQSLPIAAPLTQAQAASATANTTLWVLDGGSEDEGYQRPSRLVALDSQSGELRLQVPYYYAEAPTSNDGTWKYVVETVMRGFEQVTLLTQLDLRRGAIARILDLSNPYDQAGALYRNRFTQVAQSPNNARLAVVTSSVFNRNWYMSVALVDPATGQTSAPNGWLLLDSTKSVNDDVSPLVWARFVGDGSRLLVMQSILKDLNQTSWSTKLAVFQVNADPRRGVSVETTRDISNQIQFSRNPPQALLEPDTRTLYLLQFAFEDASPLDYRFVALDINTLQVLRAETVERAQGREPFCNNAPQLTPGGRYLYAYCIGNLIQRGGEFRFLDTQTGLVTKKAPLPSGALVENGYEFSPRLIPSPDQKQVYVLAVSTNVLRVAVLNVAQQAIVRDANFQSKRASLDPLPWVTELLVSTASAKGEGYGVNVVISPDGKRLYIASPFGEGQGLWVIDTHSLQAIGQWFKAQAVSGLQLSADGRELYVLTAYDRALRVVDATTGETLRTFDKMFQSPSGFAP